MKLNWEQGVLKPQPVSFNPHRFAIDAKAGRL